MSVAKPALSRSTCRKSRESFRPVGARDQRQEMTPPERSTTQRRRRRPQRHRTGAPPVCGILRGDIQTELMPDRGLSAEQPRVDCATVQRKRLEAPQVSLRLVELEQQVSGGRTILPEIHHFLANVQIPGTHRDDSVTAGTPWLRATPGFVSYGQLKRPRYYILVV
jgi:hypothetical protein